MREQVVDVAGVVLPVAIDLNGDVVAVLERVQVAALHRAADAEVEGKAQHGGAGFGGAGGGLVA